MTQEEKQLLLKDLCARLPYEIRMNCGTIKQSHVLQCVFIDVMDRHCDIMDDVGLTYAIEDIKPYLRPMSSMTDEEKNDFFQLMGNGTDIQRVDFYNVHHFDYRGLIPMGLALEAPEGMYNTKTTCNNCEDKNYCSQSEYVKNNSYKLK